MELTLNTKHRTLTVKMRGELDHHSARAVREAIDAALVRSSAENIAFDFSQVTFMDSSGIGVIMGRYKRVRAIGGRIFIYGMNTEITRIMEMSGIHNIAVVSDTGDAVSREV